MTSCQLTKDARTLPVKPKKLADNLTQSSLMLSSFAATTRTMAT